MHASFKALATISMPCLHLYYFYYYILYYYIYILLYHGLSHSFSSLPVHVIGRYSFNEYDTLQRI